MYPTPPPPRPPRGAKAATPGTDRRDNDIPVDPDAAAGPTSRSSHLWVSKRLDVLVAVAAGGAFGSLARYEITRAFPVGRGQFPTSTLVVNTAGAFVLVLLVERLPPSRYVRAFLAVGAIGAFTTFSTFAVETIQLADDDVRAAATFVIASTLAGLMLAWLGIVAARAIPHRHPPSSRNPGEEST